MNKTLVEKKLEHYGVLGMKWGVRKSRTASKSSKETSALRKKKAFELTDEELKKVNKRLDLEQRYNQLNPSKLNNAQKAIGKVVGNIAKNVITDVGTRYAKKIIEGTA